MVVVVVVCDLLERYLTSRLDESCDSKRCENLFVCTILDWRS